ncbi:gas vesicle protein [Leptolyngbya ohadii]|uniref:gas vesicle protein n=1 Tax=Leptolyngbya ohadii TaxID=1962290 RepID=UPI000B59A5DA|nr:gas vesicle protein [Leptolyngbya ohadii]
MRRIPPNRIQPKISTLPRQRSEAAAFLDIYKLVIEKKRLQQELENMEQRREQIVKRLAALDIQVTDLESSAHQIREQGDRIPAESPKPKANPFPQPTESFETFFLEY